MPTKTQAIIAEQNDRFRRGDQTIPGQVVVTAGIQHLIEEAGHHLTDIFDIVREFDVFTEDNDPHGERDFGRFDFEGQSCYWKIDLYVN